MIITTNGNYVCETKAGKRHVASVQGSFGGGTVKFQWSHDGTTWTDFTIDGSSIALTAAGGYELSVPSSQCRIVLSGATTPSLNANITVDNPYR